MHILHSELDEVGVQSSHDSSIDAFAKINVDKEEQMKPERRSVKSSYIWLDWYSMCQDAQLRELR